jgi:hypothetical protein
MYFHIRQHTLKALPLPVIDSFTTEVEALGILGKTIEHEGKFHLLTVEEMCDLMDFPGYLVGVVDDEELNMYPDEEPKYYSSIGDYIRTLM